MSCIKAVPDICYAASNDKSPDKDKAYSKQRACLIVDYVKSARKNLIAAEQQKKFYDGLSGSAKIAGNWKEINEEDKTVDKLAQITSVDIEKDIKISNDKILKEADECEAGMEKTKCRQFLDDKKDKNDEAVAEFGLRQNAKEEHMKTVLGSGNDKKISSYLKEEGYTDKEVKEQTKDAASIDNIRTQILERYKAEKEAIIADMAARVASKSTVKDATINAGDKDNFKKIKDELSSRSEDMKNLIHFNNIVASYLTIEDTGTKKQSRNSAALKAEVKAMSPADAKRFLEAMKKENIGNEKNENADLTVDKINELLKYK
jgi:hypothetical protein